MKWAIAHLTKNRSDLKWPALLNAMVVRQLQVKAVLKKKLQVKAVGSVSALSGTRCCCRVVFAVLTGREGEESSALSTADS